MTELGPSLNVETFAIDVGDEVWVDLRARIRATRWPDPAPAQAWEQGTDLDYLRDLLSYWADGYDWPAQQRYLNSFDHFRAEVDGHQVHFVHHRAMHGNGIPLIVTHGWPSSFVEYLPLVPLLTDPAAHGIDGPAFDVVIPSLPGYGYSERPPQTGVTTRVTARRWHRLMRGLGYQRYGAQGGDTGEAVTLFMALDNPDPLLGIHLHTLLGSPYLDPAVPLAPAEQEYVAQIERWDEAERGYSSVQSTKPQTVGYGLADSPAGLAAWILEKWRSWADSGGDLDARFSRDFLLTMLTLYWATNTITSSMRDYYDKRWFLKPVGPHDFVTVPTGIALFDNQFVFTGNPPREWAERLFNVQRWTQMPRGGGFAPIEEPELLARDIAAFFADR
ncbi:MAG: epoxide hydrolase [Sporichthyaceae bacterium]|nr:epoxide hydrolase [Sporichthyaceae bacterium]